MKLKSFVAKVVLHVTQDYFRQKYRRREEELDKYDTGEQRVKTEEGISPKDDDYILNRLDLEAALDDLPPKSRTILLLKSQGYNYEEISEKTGLSVSGVKMQVKRSLEQLRSTFWS
jgi:RNA polymerase sigma factor (sigma-70 family)